MAGTPVAGPPVVSRVYLLGQAPGPHEAAIGRPFAWTAGRTLFSWFNGAFGMTEESFRANVYMSAVARCFPGKGKGGGDRKPDLSEVEACREFVAREVAILRPNLVIPVGALAVEQVLGEKHRLVDVIGRRSRVTYHGVEVDVIALPHPSGASTWHRTEPGQTLLRRALDLIGSHAEFSRSFSDSSRDSARPPGLSSWTRGPVPGSR